MASGQTNDAAPREVTVEEAIAAHYGEWILMRVTGRDEYYAPQRGIVIAHSPSRTAISAAFRKEPSRAEDPTASYYTFNAFPRRRPDETIEQARARFSEQRSAAMGAARVAERA